MNVLFSPIVANKVVPLGTLTGGDVFVFHTVDMDISNEVSSGGAFMVLKDSQKEGSVRVVNVASGLVLQRDSDRNVVKLQATLSLSF